MELKSYAMWPSKQTWEAGVAKKKSVKPFKTLMVGLNQKQTELPIRSSEIIALEFGECHP